MAAGSKYLGRPGGGNGSGGVRCSSWRWRWSGAGWRERSGGETSCAVPASWHARVNAGETRG